MPRLTVHPRMISRERAIADHVPQHHHPPDVQLSHLREHRLQRRPIAVDVREDGNHGLGFLGG